MTHPSYKESGVDIELGDKTIDAIKTVVAQTQSENVLRGLGLFSGFYQIDLKKYRQPVLVSSIDGVGTKVKIAEMAGSYESVGVDLVNHCVNDIMVCGADPLFFLDYIAVDKLSSPMIQDIVVGMARACKLVNCAMVGGETAEMPGVYQENNFDLAGAIVGIVEKSNIIDGRNIKESDVLIGLCSNGLHTNGFSLVRKILFEKNHYSINQFVDSLGVKLADELLKTHKSYDKVIRRMKSLEGVHGIAHITGGGIAGNTNRIIDKNLRLNIDWQAWDIPPIFKFLQTAGNIPDEEMRTAFNLGIGLVVVADESHIGTVQDVCRSVGEETMIIGVVESRKSGE